MVGVTMAGTYEGKPLEVLGKLIEERKRILGESAEDAVVATGIDALISLRTLTKMSPKNIRKSEYSFVRDYSKAPYITLRGRRNPYGLDPILGRRWKFTHLPGTSDAREYIVYPYTGRHRGKNGKMVGGDRIAEWNEVLRFKGLRPIRRRGLAKTVLGAMANEMSTKPGRNFQIELQRYHRGERVYPPKGGFYYISGVRRMSEAFCEMRLVDKLNYAMFALKNGPASVELALQKAANRIAGRLCKVAEKKFGEKIQTPFPEVKKRKVA